MKEYYISTPLKKEDIEKLRSGDRVYLSGVIYSARDSAHQKIFKYFDDGLMLPFSLKNNVIYYVGPTPAKDGEVIGSAGPTTSYRMDKFTPKLLDNGLKGMIGKGKRDESVKKSILINRAVYFGATGGAAALISKHIVGSEILAFEELGPEAVREMKVHNMPLIVIYDSYGNDLYEEGMENWKEL